MEKKNRKISVNMGKGYEITWSGRQRIKTKMIEEKTYRASRTHGAVTKDLTFVSMESQRKTKHCGKKNLKKKRIFEWNEQISKSFERSFSKRNIKSKWSYNYSNKLKLQFKIFHKGSTSLRNFYWWALQNMQGRKNSNLMQIILENKKK